MTSTLFEIETSLRTEPIKWVADFLEADGLQMLTETLATSILLKSHPDSQLQQQQCIKAFKAILNTDVIII